MDENNGDDSFMIISDEEDSDIEVPLLKLSSDDDDNNANIGNIGFDVIENNGDINMNNSDEEGDLDVEVQRLADSDYESDESVFEDRIDRDLDLADINSYNELTRMCCIYFCYAIADGTYFCTSCFIRMAYLFDEICAVREHSINIYALILGLFCSECRTPLFQIFPCNMCPICMT